jgi:hypothetical protein
MGKTNKTATILSRRDFLKLTGLGLGGLAFRSLKGKPFETPGFPQGDQLGRVTVGKTELRSRPDPDSQTVGNVYEDMVVAWLRETVGRISLYVNQRWVETPDGYIRSAYLQPVRNSLNAPRTALPAPNGMWVEVTLPYIDLTLENPPARSPGLADRIALGLAPRLYYSQVVWADKVKTDEQGQSGTVSTNATVRTATFFGLPRMPFGPLPLKRSLRSIRRSKTNAWW